MEGLDGFGEQPERHIGLAIRSVQAGRVAGDETFKETDAVLVHKGDALLPGRQRPPGVRAGEGHAGDP